MQFNFALPSVAFSFCFLSKYIIVICFADHQTWDCLAILLPGLCLCTQLKTSTARSPDKPPVLKSWIRLCAVHLA